MIQLLIAIVNITSINISTYYLYDITIIYQNSIKDFCILQRKNTILIIYETK